MKRLKSSILISAPLLIGSFLLLMLATTIRTNMSLLWMSLFILWALIGPKTIAKGFMILFELER